MHRAPTSECRVGGHVAGSRSGVDELLDRGLRSIGARDDLEPPRRGEIGQVSGLDRLLGRRADRDHRHPGERRPGEHRPFGQPDLELAEDLGRAVDLPAGGDAPRAVVPDVRAVPARFAVQEAALLDDGLVECAVRARERDPQAIGHAEAVRAGLERLRQEGRDCRRVGLEEDELHLDVAVPGRQHRENGGCRRGSSNPGRTAGPSAR